MILFDFIEFHILSLWSFINFCRFAVCLQSQGRTITKSNNSCQLNCDKETHTHAANGRCWHTRTHAHTLGVFVFRRHMCCCFYQLELIRLRISTSSFSLFSDDLRRTQHAACVCVHVCVSSDMQKYQSTDPPAMFRSSTRRRGGGSRCSLESGDMKLMSQR